MRFFMFCLVQIVVAVVDHSASAAERPMNLLYITADDMNWDSSGWMGSNLGATPALDGLAAQSHRFIHHHVTAPICMPSREAMLTGRVPHRSGGLGFTPIRPGTPTLVTTLKANDYYTAAINKIAHMKPDAEFPWDDTLSGSGKKPPLLREHLPRRCATPPPLGSRSSSTSTFKIRIAPSLVRTARTWKWRKAGISRLRSVRM